MTEKIINELTSYSDEELKLIAEKVAIIRSNRRHEKIEELKENFVKAWKELEKMGVCICSQDDVYICLDDITFEY